MLICYPLKLPSNRPDEHLEHLEHLRHCHCINQSSPSDDRLLFEHKIFRYFWRSGSVSLLSSSRLLKREQATLSMLAWLHSIVRRTPGSLLELDCARYTSKYRVICQSGSRKDTLPFHELLKLIIVTTLEVCLLRVQPACWYLQLSFVRNSMRSASG